MDRATFEREAARNQQAYALLRDTIRSQYAGRYVALADGKIIASALTFDETQAAAEQMQPSTEFCLIFPADLEPSFDLAWDF